MTTTIQISDKAWQKMNIMRKNAGETYNQVLERILKLKKEENENGETNKMVSMENQE